MICFCFIFLLVVLLFGCCGLFFVVLKYVLMFYDEFLKYFVDFKYFDYVNLDVLKGGIFCQVDFGGFDSFNLFIGKGVLVFLLGLIYDILVFQLQDELFIEYGLFVEKIEKVLDNSYVCFYLCFQVCFSDGMLVIVEDVVFIFEMLVSKGDLMYCNYYVDVDKVVVEDKFCVCFDFKYVGNCELLLIFGQIVILLKYWWVDCDFFKIGMEILVGSGFYCIVKVDLGCFISYE